jgi:hypothetical protein
MTGLEIEHRRGGQTLFISELNAVWVDDHTSWYAVHWNTNFSPASFTAFCRDKLSLNDGARALMRLTDDSTPTEHLGRIINRIYDTDGDTVEFLRFDAVDCVLVWEPSLKYENLRRSENVPYTAIAGFGSDKFDKDFIWDVLQSATAEIDSKSQEIISALSFLGDRFSRDSIDPSKKGDY